MMDTLQITDLKVHFRSGGSAPIRAVDGLTLSIGPRETVGLVGESGCGKSTVSNASVGLIAPTSGSVRVLDTELAGADAKTLRTIRAHAQMVFQEPATSLNPRMTVGAAIGEPLLVRKLARGVALRTRVAELLEEVGLRPEYATRYPHQFSGGQRQRIVIARALALRPALLVCDEPFQHSMFRSGRRSSTFWSNCSRAMGCPRCSLATILPWCVTCVTAWP